MKRRELVRFALAAIIAHPMRSALTTLGVVIGVASVVTMTAIGLGVQKQIEDQISGMGSNLIIVSPGNTRGGGGGFVNQGGGSNISIDEDDANAIREGVEGITVVSTQVRGGGQLVAEGANWGSQIFGADADYLTARDMEISAGRYFDADEVRQGRKVLVIGQTVATNLFGDSDPVGQRIRVGRVPFEVVGLLKSKGQSGMGQDQDDLVIGPIGAIRSRVLGRRVRAGAVQNIYVKAENDDNLLEVQERVAAVIRERHKIQPGEDDDFSIQNMSSILETRQQASKTFTLLLGSVAGVSLVVGGVGIMNIMLVAVTERTREIGLRMALGAKRSDILIQFAIEAVALSLLGGLLGLLLGVIGAFLMGKTGGWVTAIPSWSAPLALGFSMFVGLVFGAYPSWRAAQLDPIEALRRD